MERGVLQKRTEGQRTDTGGLCSLAQHPRVRGSMPRAALQAFPRVPRGLAGTRAPSPPLAFPGRAGRWRMLEESQAEGEHARGEEMAQNLPLARPPAFLGVSTEGNISFLTCSRLFLPCEDFVLSGGPIPVLVPSFGHFLVQIAVAKLFSSRGRRGSASQSWVDA